MTDRDYAGIMANKWLVTLKNKKRFESNSYTDGKIMIEESEIEWMPFIQSGAVTINYEIKETVIAREDNLFMGI